MSGVAPVIPWVVDPIGGLVHATTGFGKTPFGVIKKVVTPPRPRPVAGPQPRPQPEPSMPSIQMPEWPTPPTPPTPPIGPQVPPALPTRPGKEPAGAGAGADVTQGLLRQKRPGRQSLLGGG